MSGVDDWSERVRYAAIQGLVRLCRCTEGDSLRDGLRVVAWNAMVQANSIERDVRVLEAVKLVPVNIGVIYFFTCYYHVGLFCMFITLCNHVNVLVY